MYKIGVLALQGAFARHISILKQIGQDTFAVRDVDSLEQSDALVMPGGESSTIGKLLDGFGLTEPLKIRIREGLPLFATCAGTILLAKDIIGSNQMRLGLLDMSIERNAYGRQIESFESFIKIPPLDGPPFKAVFIRAPRIEKIGEGIEVIADFESKPVLIQSNNILAATFHPELTEDTRLHEFFISLLKSSHYKANKSSRKKIDCIQR